MGRRAEIIKHIKGYEHFISPLALRLTEIVADPDHELKDFTTAVKADASLTATLLKAINSPIYGLINKVTSIERAITYLGESFVLSVSLKSGTDKKLNRELPGYDRPPGTFWDHSLKTAIAAKQVAVMHNKRMKDDIAPDMAYTCGLLHDLGKVVLSDYMEQSTEFLLESMAQEGTLSNLQAEENLLAITHVMAGHLLAQSWNLPSPMPSVIKLHHHPGNAIDQYQALTHCVYIGNILAATQDEPEDIYKTHGPFFNRYTDLPLNSLDSVMFRTEQEFQRTTKILNEL